MINFCKERTTEETEIRVQLSCEPGKVKVNTPESFVSHLVRTMIVHAGWSGQVAARAMIDPDGHHLAEDCGLVLGQAVRQGLNTMSGYGRYGWAIVPMDDALARVAVDVGGRPYACFELPGSIEPGVGWNWDVVRELWAGLSRGLQAACHVTCLGGVSGHHAAEAMAKALGLALGQACQPSSSIISTKGTIG